MIPKLITAYSAQILTAADFIEKNPDCYNFYSGEIPKTKNDRGCLLAWIGYFCGMRSGHYTHVAARVGLPLYAGQAASDMLSPDTPADRMSADRMATWARRVVEQAKEFET